MGDFRCALPSRAGRTILIGDQRVAVGADGVARGVSGAAAAFLSSQPHVWQLLPAADAPEQPPSSEALLLPEAAAPAVPPPEATVVLPRRGGRRGSAKKRLADSP